MIQHAQAESPNECCGLLGGVITDEGVRLVRKRYPLINEAASPIEYRAAPRGLLQADKDMRTHDWIIVAIYHSHPTSPPIPSRTDLQRNYSPDVINFIISLHKPSPEMLGWWLTDLNFEEAAWEIVEG
jgi:proteasome lid subunit RPN8/RPN11